MLLTWRYSDLDGGDGDVDVHAAVGRLRECEREVRGSEQVARRHGRARRSQRSHHYLAPRDRTLRHHALLALAELETSFHLGIQTKIH